MEIRQVISSPLASDGLVAEEKDLKTLKLDLRVSALEERFDAQDERLMGGIDPSTKRFQSGLEQDVIDVKIAIQALKCEIELVRSSAQQFVSFAKMTLLRGLQVFGVVTAALVSVIGGAAVYVATHLPQLARAAHELTG